MNFVTSMNCRASSVLAAIAYVVVAPRGLGRKEGSRGWSGDLKGA